LAIALLFALAGLFAVDRTIAESNRNRVEIEALQSGALVEGFLAVHAEGLQAMRGLYLDTTHGPNPAHFKLLVTSLSEYAPAFRRIFITDTAGRITGQHLFGRRSDPLPTGLAVDTARIFALADLARDARRSRRTETSSPGPLLTGERGLVLLEPIYVENSFRGFVGGTVTAPAILERIGRGRHGIDSRLVITTGSDTIAVRAPSRAHSSRLVNSSSASISVPGGDQWKLVVEQPSTYADVRFLLWAIGLATLVSLIVVLLHEHHQNQRLAERSTELERLSTELLRANRVKSEFLANVSHELRTPLNAIVGFVELLHDGVYGELGQRQIQPVDRIASSASYLRQLVDQILDLAKMAAGRLEMHVELLDLRAFVLDVASEVEALVNERHLSLSIAASGALPRVHTDPMHLRQIMLNLLGNAIKFTPVGGGGIAIRASLVANREERPQMFSLSPAVAESRTSGLPAFARQGTWIALQVADSGIGIAPADHERIFDEFEQINAGPRSDSAQRGTGLGLPISRRLARLIGGDITVVSDLGKGAAFTVWIPVDSDDGSIAEDGAATTKRQRPVGAH
jgi:Signal transduction histidine kinase